MSGVEFRGKELREYLQKSGVVMATHNQGKLRELRELLKDYQINLYSLTDFQVDVAVPETGSSFRENSTQKAQGYYRLLERPVLADDSGLEVEALQGEPGIYSARYGGEGLDDRGRCEYLLTKLAESGSGNRRARFVAELALALDGDATHTLHFRGEVHGAITTELRGSGGFGYDPIFQPEGESQSFGELSAEKKGSISHRARAVAELLGALE